MTQHQREPLRFETLDVGRTFPPLRVTIDDAQVGAYVDATGDDWPGYDRIVPPGYAAILGRQAYLRHYDMPPGGVLLRETIEWIKPARIGIETIVQARVVDRSQQGNRRRVVFAAVARQQGEDVARVEIHAGWPA
jgi:acyl dehydratase